MLPDEETDMFYLPQMNKHVSDQKKDLSISPSRKYIPVRNSTSYSKKLFQRPSRPSSRNYESPQHNNSLQSQKIESSNQMRSFKLSQVEEIKSEAHVPTSDFNKFQPVDPIIEESPETAQLKPELKVRSDSNDKAADVQESAKVSEFGPPEITEDSFHDDDTVIVDSEVLRSVKKDQTQRSPRISSLKLDKNINLQNHNQKSSRTWLGGGEKGGSRDIRLNLSSAIMAEQK